MNIHQGVKNISYSLGANSVSLGVSVLMVMFVPKLLPVEDYGKWQLFLFYFSYLGFLHFGWEDGIYLRYAGKEFSALNPQLFSGQFLGIIVLQLFLSGIACVFAREFIMDSIKQNVFIYAVSLAVFVNFNTGCNFIMQITNQIKEYAELVLSGQLVLLVLVFIFLIIGFSQFYYMYLAKLGSLVVVSILSLYLCRQLWTSHIGSIHSICHEAGLNLEVGIQLMFANIASMLIIGIVRYGISIGWDVATFGRVSLTLGISNFLMIFINSISVVFFPILKRMDQQRLPEMYVQIRLILACILFFMLIFYYPIKAILSWWLPKYADSLIYMAVLFPVCLFESKVSLLINTYLKSMRKEALMLKINLISVGVAVVITAITIEILHNLGIAVFSIVFLYAFRCEMAEWYMGRLLSIKLKKDIMIELAMVAVFIVSSVILNSWMCTLIYAVAYAIYMLSNHKQIVAMWRMMRGRY
jgi:O-antigen/teichoic acid export membrane protein